MVKDPRSNHVTITLAPDVAVHVFTQSTGEPYTSHLLVAGDQSWLIDCHDGQLAEQIESLNLPLPSRIFHTHIQPQHTRENQDSALANAAIYVHRSDRILAADRAAYDKLTHTTWDNPIDWPRTLGQELFGVAGSVTMLPPDSPLNVTHTFKASDLITLDEARQLAFKVIPLPGHGGEHASGLLLLHGQKPLALFTGDLMRHPATLVNIYDLEYAYGKTWLEYMSATLTAVAELGATIFFPATGPVIPDGPTQAQQLAHKIDQYHQARLWRSGQFNPQQKTRPQRLGRWFNHAPGVYQLSQFGNTIVLIDEQGRGLLVDPGPCEFGDGTRTERFEKDLDQLHEHAGLTTIERVLITHFHGDHIDMTPLIRQRYPGLHVAAWGPVADVIADPQKYPYPCTLPWYNLGGPTSIACEDRLRLDTPYQWNDIAIRTIHLPGHCYVHAAYLLTCRGLDLAITGDTIQSHGDADALDFIIANDSVPDARRGQLKGLYQLVKEPVDLNLGGHSSFFTHARPVYEESIRRIQHAQAALKAIVPNGDLHKAFFRPWFPDVELV